MKVLSKKEMIKRNKIKRVLAEQEILVCLLLLRLSSNVSTNIVHISFTAGNVQPSFYCDTIS